MRQPKRGSFSNCFARIWISKYIDEMLRGNVKMHPFRMVMCLVYKWINVKCCKYLWSLTQSANCTTCRVRSEHCTYYTFACGFMTQCGSTREPQSCTCTGTEWSPHSSSRKDHQGTGTLGTMQHVTTLDNGPAARLVRLFSIGASSFRFRINWRSVCH